MTTSSLRTKSSFEMAAAVVAAVSVTMPVLETSELPGRASMRADAFWAGAGCEVDWKRTLRAGVRRRERPRGGGTRGAKGVSSRHPPSAGSGREGAHGARTRGWTAWRATRAADERSMAGTAGADGGRASARAN